jgi:FixJ family two-component response regulator
MSSAMEKHTITILLIEDDHDDTLLIREMLAEVTSALYTFRLEHADTLAAGLAEYDIARHDVLLLDLGLPDSNGMDTLVAASGRCPDGPIVVLTGLSDELFGVEAVKNGAQDYLIKGRINGDILLRSICYAIERKKLENKERQLVQELREAIEKIKTLKGLIPICASCKKVRDDRGYWNQVEVYIAEHSEAEFSHGICPDCADRLYGRFLKKVQDGDPGRTDQGKASTGKDAPVSGDST